MAPRTSLESLESNDGCVWIYSSLPILTRNSQDGQTALHQAASGGHGETVAALILAGCDISLQDFVSRTETTL